MFVLQAKLRHLKGILTKWAFATFGSGCSLSSSIRQLFQMQKDILQCTDSIQLAILVDQENSLSQNLTKALLNENKMDKQKTKLKLLAHGNKNSATFHASLKIQQASANISSIHDKNDNLCSSHDDIQTAFLDYFQDILASKDIPDMHMQHFAQPTLPTISGVNKEILLKKVTVDDVKNSIFGMKSSSSPGPDGYNAHFFKITWHIIGDDVIKAIKNFFKHNKLLTGINATRIALTPKTQQPYSVNQFRPITS